MPVVASMLSASCPAWVQGQTRDASVALCTHRGDGETGEDMHRRAQKSFH